MYPRAPLTLFSHFIPSSWVTPHIFSHTTSTKWFLNIWLWSKPLNWTAESSIKMPIGYFIGTGYQRKSYLPPVTLSLILFIRNGATLNFSWNPIQKPKNHPRPLPLVHLSKSISYKSYRFYSLSVSISLPFPWPSPTFRPFLHSCLNSRLPWM